MLNVNKPDIERVLFPVESKTIYIKQNVDDATSLFPPKESYNRISNFKAITDSDGSIFSIVTDNYRLVTNADAIKMGKECFRLSFPSLDANAMEVFNIIMPRSRSFCHVDFIHKDAKFATNIGKNDSWQPYLRVTNSYNRTFALNFDLGFCRWICKNGVIFGKKNIAFKFYHSKSEANPQVTFNVNSKELARLQSRFIDSITNLSRYWVNKKFMWPLACKIFGFKYPEEKGNQSKLIWEERKNHCIDLTSKYFTELGENGYAALNVLTDFATRPVGYISSETMIDNLQKKCGSWTEEFLNATANRDFRMEDYLGDFIQYAA